MKTLQITVKPNARQNELKEVDGRWVARVKAPPVDGKANLELIRLVAGHFGVPPSRVSIKTGAGARIKRVCVEE